MSYKFGWENDVFYDANEVRGSVVRDKKPWWRKRWAAIVRPGYRRIGTFWRKANAQRAIEAYAVLPR